MAALFAAVWPEDPVTAVTLKANDASLDPNYLARREVVEQDEQIVACGTVYQFPWAYDPGKYWLDFCVHPHYERQGIGTAYLEHILAFIVPRDPLTLSCETRESKPQSIRFLQKHGFVETMRFRYFELDVPAFKPERFYEALDRVHKAAIEIISVTELQKREPGWQRIIYDLHWELTQDVPSTIKRTRPEFDLYVKRVFERADFLPDGWQVAVDGDGCYVGLTMLRRKDDPHKLYTGITGVVRRHRRKGIATALKVQAITYAQRLGTKTIQADNEENNPMHLLNQALGFRPLPAGILFSKKFTEE